MGLVDVHCHLDFSQFDMDLDEVIERAGNAGVSCIVQNGVNPESNRKSISIAERYPEIVKPAMGMYPTDGIGLSEDEFSRELDFIEKNRELIIALGEVGIDHHWTKDDEGKRKQEQNFHRIISLAEKIRKPLIVHSRDAERETFEMLQSSNAKRVIMHCFNGDLTTIKEAEDEGYYFTIPTIVLRNKHFRKMAKRISSERILTETDGPYLSPFPGKRNEPAFIRKAVDKIAELRGEKPAETENQIMDNFRRIFNS